MPCDWSKTDYSGFDDCVAQNQDKDDPGAYCAGIMHKIGGEELEILKQLAFYREKHPKKEGFAETKRHKDFTRIHDEFVKYYCKGKPACGLADTEYYTWLNGYNLDETKAYGAATESFSFIKDMIKKWKEDAKNVFYKVLVAFPVTSMNGNVYEKGDLIAMAHSLVGAPINMNHKTALQMPGVGFEVSQFEDGAVEAVLKVPKSTICPVCTESNKPLYQMIDEKRILNVSLEGEGQPFRFTGCALLTTDVLPGIPMARIFPMERYLSEAFSAPKTLKVKTRRIEILGMDMTPPKKKETIADDLRSELDVTVKKIADVNKKLDVLWQKHREPPQEPDPEITTLNTELDILWAKRQQLTTAIAAKEHKETPEPEGTDAPKEASPAPDNILELSTLRVDKRKLELKVQTLETRLLETEKSLVEESQNHIKAEGRIIELQNQVHKIEASMVESNKDKVKDDVTIKEWQRRNQDIGDAHGKLKTDHEALVISHTALDAKYRDALKQNLDLSGRLTSTNEQHLAAMNKVTELEEKLAKARRLGKIIVKQ